ncbi:DUF2490 domain-containing protein [Aquimarina sp. D1M17]|uniref:DUF2490 domain-containing protein n=1 Tax=Aquimarina acroporae TaxID=2937283 RepID=UPI0020C037C9|nr:DUF2490 domain-containing protein [Aquimarina acroporae]MCK8522926.1 DUF2490 domain-containing protein [Aquimarina acroporae]
MRILISLIVLIVISQGTWAQSSFSSGLLPKIRVSIKLGDHLKWVNGIESRQLIIDNTKENSIDYEYVLTDFSTLLSHKIGSNLSLNGGYLLRIEENDISHRTIQQFNIIHAVQSLRLGHRFVTDQTFNNSTSPKFRLRYRITMEKALSGQKIDPGELYLKIGNEYLGSLQSNESDLEIRVIPFVGYEIDNKNKIEMGVDYRVGNFINATSENDLWLSFNWYYSLDWRK